MGVKEFLVESLQIEGIYREPTAAEFEATELFLKHEEINVEVVKSLQSVYAPGYPIRGREGMNVRVGGHYPPNGGPDVLVELDRVLGIADPFKCHCEFEWLHPFMDGNGRVGRTIWAWKMSKSGRFPFYRPFLQNFYYQGLGFYDKYHAPIFTLAEAQSIREFFGSDDIS